ncbi:MAG: protease modulator HflC [Verrucomicrobia bacterium]|nr:protease modulator HflC [Verrucomicrobiota bacterium]
MKRNPLTILVGVLLLMVFVLLLFVYQVRKSQVAIVTTFGKATGEPTGPGAHLKWPWPIQKVYKFDQRIHNLESRFEQMLTADGYNLLIAVYVGWTLNDPKLFFPRFGDSIRLAEESLEDLLRNSYSSVVGQHPFAHFVSADEKVLQFTAIEQEILERVKAEVRLNNYGIDVKFLGIQKLGLPESVTESVFDQMRKERQLQVSTIQSEGDRQASDIRSAADAESAKMLADADARATRIRAQGESEAAKTFAIFEQDPELANFILRLRALEAFVNDKAVLILDTQTSPLNLLKGVRAPERAGAPIGAATGGTKRSQP